MTGLGILGTGRWAGAHARAAARSNSVEIVHCISRSEERRSDYASEYGIPRHSESIQELIADPTVEGVVVATPNDVHVEMALKVLEAGKPVLIDKPVSVDLAEGLTLARLSESLGVAVGVAHHPRRMAGHRAAKAWVTEHDAIVRLAYANFSNIRGTALKPDAWHRFARGSEAGVLIQVGIHPVDTLLSLMGPAVGVNAQFSFGVVGPEVPDTATVTMRHANGAQSVVGTNWSTPSNYRVDLLTTQGNLLFSADHTYWTSPDIDANSELLLDTDGEVPRPLPLEAGDPLRDQLEELGAAARREGEMTISVWDGLRAIGVVLSSVDSARSNGAFVSTDQRFRDAGATEAELERLFS